MIKERFGQNHVVFGSDISPAAVAESVEWQRVLRQTLDGVFACRSYEIPLTDEAVDLVIVFAAAHHFGAQSERWPNSTECSVLVGRSSISMNRRARTTSIDLRFAV